MRRTAWRVVPLVVVICGLILAKGLVFPDRTTKAAPQEPFGTCVSTVPQDWGQFKGGSQQAGVIFEDKQGTLRFVTSFPCNGVTPPVALVVRRTPKN